MTDRHQAIIGVGSNVAEATDMIAQALQALTEAGCVIVGQSDQYMTATPYLNQVVAVETALEYADLADLGKQIERGMGRTPEMKQRGLVPIDLDVVVYDGAVMRPRDFSAPYFTTGYTQLHQKD